MLPLNHAFAILYMAIYTLRNKKKHKNIKLGKYEKIYPKMDVKYSIEGE